MAASLSANGGEPIEESWRDAGSLECFMSKNKNAGEKKKKPPKPGKVKRVDGLKMKKVDKFTMRAVVDCTARNYTKKLALKIYGVDDSAITYGRLKTMVDSISCYLLEQGFQSGDKIAILGESCPGWLLAYLGITCCKGVAVPILPDFSAKEVMQILTHSGAKGIVVNGRHFEKCLPFAADGSKVLIRMEDLFHIPGPISAQITDAAQFSNAPGRDTTRLKPTKKQLVALVEREPAEEDLASLIYTSGTTGNPKGVMLTHRNIVWNADVSTDMYVKIRPGDRVLSILPMSHVYEFTIGQILVLLCGVEIHYLGKTPAPSVLLPAMKKVRPHIMLSVPLLIEKVYRSAVLPKLRDNPRLKSWLKWGVTRRMISRIIGRKLKMTFGARLKFFGIGGAPLDGEVEKFLYEAGFPYAIGYGLTETAPLLAGCGPKNQHVGFIGKIVPHVTLRLANKDSGTGVGEIEVKGPNVMLGYYGNESLTKEAFTDDGYFRTGDLGMLDKKGRLAIKGRTKTMILGPGGENIYPELIESVINNQSFVQESLVVPDEGGLLAMVKLDLESFAEKMSLNINDAKAEAAKYIAKLREEVNKELSASSRLSDVELQEEPFQRTPTQKIKRFLYDATRRKDKEKDTEKADADSDTGSTETNVKPSERDGKERKE